MEEEIIDIINEKNEVIGKENKEIALEKNLMRRVVHIWIFNSEEKLLIQKRGMQHFPSPGKYTSSASGHVQSRETYEEAANRELKEELGIETNLRFVSNFRVKSNVSNVIGAFFIGKYDGKFKINNAEVHSVKFADLNIIDKEVRLTPNKFSANFQECLKIYMKNK